jgi:hypothetical protein
MLLVRGDVYAFFLGITRIAFCRPRVNLFSLLYKGLRILVPVYLLYQKQKTHAKMRGSNDFK